MRKFIHILIVLLTWILPITVFGQANPVADTPMQASSVTNQGDAAVTESSETNAPSATQPLPVPVVQENTVAQCGDKQDNDNDGHVDCDDQDCRIFAICVSAAANSKPSPVATSATNPDAAADEDTSDELTVRPFSIGFVPGLSTDSAASGEVLNHFSLNLIGWQDHLHGAEFSILGAIRKGSVTGFQGSHLFNVVAGNMHGFQGAGLVNVAGGDTVGFQGAGLVNLSGASFRGIQASGLINVTKGTSTGMQGAGL
ncbi:MAG: hypothetical protein JXX14_17970, partial [Deltaproteobacteria bacterium]|nr:hypothetical protein [Deltaproteobacteria bacterium]